jgi:PIN domain nuclease of toxin-antitoxin system
VTLLDTHAWLWWLSEPALLSTPALRAVEAARSTSTLAVSAISVWELAMLVEKGHIVLDRCPHDLLAQCEHLSFLTFAPVSGRIALRSVELGPFHADPADRMIVATALQHGAELVAKDRRIRDFPGVNAVW